MKKPQFPEAAMELFRKTGARGGKARAEKQSKEQLSEPGWAGARRAAERSKKRQPRRGRVTAVYKPKRKGDASNLYVCEVVYQGKHFQESTHATGKPFAKEYEKWRKTEMERAAAGLLDDAFNCLRRIPL